jgi:hypothetical protein
VLVGDYQLVEIFSSCEVSECGWEMINMLVELISKYEVCEFGRSLSTGWLKFFPVVR